MAEKKKFRISYNSPVVLTLAVVYGLIPALTPEPQPAAAPVPAAGGPRRRLAHGRRLWQVSAFPTSKE